jgi:hypothetical protein
MTEGRKNFDECGFWAWRAIQNEWRKGTGPSFLMKKLLPSLTLIKLYGVKESEMGLVEFSF